MTVRIDCRCGAELKADPAYSGGRIKCRQCGEMVDVPGSAPEVLDRIRFACPHCTTRVMARVQSAGKPSRCPSCGKTYLVPEQQNVPLLSGQRQKSRLELVSDVDFPANALPFAFGKAATEVVHPNESLLIPPETRDVPNELTVLGGGRDGEVIRMRGPRLLVGRERDCIFRPPSPQVSRHHCVLLRDEYALRVRDLGSKSGTFVNGHRTQGEVIVHPGDRIVIGDVTLQVTSPKPAPYGGRFELDTNPSISDFVIQ